MGLFELFVGFLILSMIWGALGGSSNYSSEAHSSGNRNLHNAADENSCGIAFNNCENCRWHGRNSCRWQSNCYAPAGKYHEYVCDNYESKYEGD